MRRYALRDDQWDRIQDILPGREGHVGGTAADNRLLVEAVSQVSRRHPLARSARALWRLEDRLSALQPMGQERRFRAGFQAFGQRPRQRVHDDRRHYRARSPGVAPAPKKRRRASHRPIPRRIDHQNSRARRCPRQPCRGDAQPGPRSRSDLRRASASKPSIPAL